MLNFAEKIIVALAAANCEFVVVGGLSAVLPTLEATLLMQRELDQQS